MKADQGLAHLRRHHSPMPILTYLSLILTTFLWGGTFISGRMLAASVDPAVAAFLRFLIASTALLLLILAKEKRLIRPPRSTWLPLFFLGLSGVFAYNVFFFQGLHHITAGRAALVIAGTPLLITLLAALFFGEGLSPRKGIGILLSLAGAVVVISNGHPGELLHGGIGRGELALLGCVVSWSIYSLIGRKVLQEISPLHAVCISSLIGTTLLLIPASYHNLLPSLPAITLLDWTNLAYLGILGTAVGFSLYYQGIQRIGAMRAGIFINLVPVFAVLLSWMILGEVIRPLVLVGGMLVLSGIALANLSPVARKLS